MGVPISAILWERMRRLDPHCNINMVRTVPYANVLARIATRTWQVNISRGPGETIWIEQPRLVNALEIAVHDAERVGWPVRKRAANLPPPISAALWERLRSLDRQQISMSIGRRPTYSMKLSKDYDRTWTCNFYRASLGVGVELPTLTEALTLTVEECERRGWSASRSRLPMILRGDSVSREGSESPHTDEDRNGQEDCARLSQVRSPAPDAGRRISLGT